MKRRITWDPASRPRSYWIRPADMYRENRPKGTARRALVKRPDASLADPEWLAKERLDEPERAAWAGIHPSMMGGEYLPDLDENEVEIARIELQSVTGDVYSLRAARTSAALIRYRLCDEYPEDKHVYSFVPAESAQPLTLGEIADLLDHASVEDAGPGYDKVIWGTLAFNIDQGSGDPHEMEHFIRVVSPFYPDLTAYFELRIRQWIARRLKQGRAADRDREARLAPFASQISAIIEREAASRSWSGRYSAWGRGSFVQNRRRELEEHVLSTGTLPDG